MNDRQGGATLEREDLRAALREMKTYVDVTEEDLKRIYEIALRHAQQRMAAKIPVQEVMTGNVVAVGRDADLNEAVHLLSEHKISGMPVVDDAKRVIGVISEADLLQLIGMKKDHTFRDILRNILGEAGRAKVTAGDRVDDVMSSPALTIGPDEDVKKAAILLDERRIKRLPVVDGEGQLVGIISRGDIVRAIGKKA
ncbi:MAG: CBS domain-containing protein [Thermodesulfobacteriota bacterium]